MIVLPSAPGIDSFFSNTVRILTRLSWHFSDFLYLSSLDMSTPNDPTGVWIFVLMTGAKCLSISLRDSQPRDIYLKKRRSLLYQKCKTIQIRQKILILHVTIWHKVLDGRLPMFYTKNSTYLTNVCWCFL